MKTLHVRGRSIQVVKKFVNLGELSEQLKNFSYRVLKEDCLDLPPKNFIKRHIILTHDQRKIYEQMKKAAMAVLNGKVTTTMTVLTQLMRLHQITCGHFTADDGSTQLIPNNRITELMNILEETEGKLPLWLSPCQVAVIPITDKQHDYALEIKKALESEGIRIKCDLRNEKIGYKIRHHTLQRTSYLLVAGEREVLNKTVSVRNAKGNDMGEMSLQMVTDILTEEIKTRS